jgi:hypothetical protein
VFVSKIIIFIHILNFDFILGERGPESDISDKSKEEIITMISERNKKDIDQQTINISELKNNIKNIKLQQLHHDDFILQLQGLLKQQQEILQQHELLLNQQSNIIQLQTDQIHKLEKSITEQKNINENLINKSKDFATEAASTAAIEIIKRFGERMNNIEQVQRNNQPTQTVSVTHVQDSLPPVTISMEPHVQSIPIIQTSSPATLHPEGIDTHTVNIIHHDDDEHSVHTLIPTTTISDIPSIYSHTPTITSSIPLVTQRHVSYQNLNEMYPVEAERVYNTEETDSF